MTSRLATLGSRYAALFGGFGLVVGVSIVVSLKLGELLIAFPLSIGAGAVACLLTAWLLGGGLSHAIAGGSRIRAAALGVVVGISALLMGTVTGSLPSFFLWVLRERGQSVAATASDFIVKPLYWVGLFGIVPAICLGISFGLTLQRRFRFARQSVNT